MKKVFASLALAAAAALAASAPAHAFTPGGAFTLTGPVSFLTVRGNFTCAATFRANGTPGAGGTIVAASLSGSAICTALQPLGLPWAVSQTGPTTLAISPAGFTGPFLCGTGTLPATWNNTMPGVMTIPPTVLPVSCQFSSLGLSASPAQTFP